MHLRIAENHNKLNRKRFIVNVTHAAHAVGATTELIDDGWIIRLQKSGNTRYIYGDKFDLNSSAAAHIAHDKVATAAVLHAAGIPMVPHELLTIIKTDKGTEYNESQVMAFLQTASRPIVCKPIEGSCGNEIHLLETEDELRAFVDLASCSQAWALSPFFTIATEYRTVVVDGEVMLQYAKAPSIHDVRGGMVGAATNKKKGFAMHGLSQGAKAQKIDDGHRAAALARRAVAVTKLFNLRTASVDIIQTGNKLLVLEVNDGIALDGFAAQSAANYREALAIYQAIITKMIG